MRGFDVIREREQAWAELEASFRRMHKPAFTGLFVLMLLGGRARTARADEGPLKVPGTEGAPPGSAEERAPEKEASYAWQTLAVDGAALSLMVVGAARKERELQSLGVGTYAFGPPLVHAAHGRFGRAGIDVASRVVLPVGFGAAGFGAGYLLGSAVGSGRSRDGELHGLVLGLVGAVLGVGGGYVTAVVVDAVVLAAPDKDTARVAAKARPSVIPTAAVDAFGGSLGIAGTF